MGTRQIQDSQSTNYPPPWEHITAVPARADRALFWGRSSANWTMAVAPWKSWTASLKPETISAIKLAGVDSPPSRARASPGWETSLQRYLQ
jgi:hypothetical protein